MLKTVLCDGVFQFRKAAYLVILVAVRIVSHEASEGILGVLVSCMLVWALAIQVTNAWVTVLLQQPPGCVEKEDVNRAFEDEAQILHKDTVQETEETQTDARRLISLS